MAHGLMQYVLDFHKKFKRIIGDPRSPDVSVDQEFRFRLIKEEYEELVEALADYDQNSEEQIIAVADALGDLLYVIAGAAVTWGIDLGTIVDVIHESNMTKSLDHVREDGKILKGPDYVPPKIKEALELQAYEAEQDGLGEDSWWPTPQRPYDHFVQEEAPVEVTDKIMVSAKEQAKILAMKDIKADLVPDTKSSGLTQDGRPYTSNVKALQKALGLSDEQMAKMKQELKEAYEGKFQGLAESTDFVDEEPTKPVDRRKPEPVVSSKPIQECTCPHQDAREPWHDKECTSRVSGYMTSYGVYILTCTCDRNHAIQAKHGSRGGLALSGKAECMCGKAYTVDFSDLNSPKVTATTIEALRKAE